MPAAESSALENIEDAHVGDQRPVGCARGVHHRFGMNIRFHDEGEIPLDRLQRRQRQRRPGGDRLRLRGHGIDEYLAADQRRARVELRQDTRMDLAEARQNLSRPEL